MAFVGLRKPMVGKMTNEKLMKNRKLVERLLESQ